MMAMVVDWPEMMAVVVVAGEREEEERETYVCECVWLCRVFVGGGRVNF